MTWTRLDDLWTESPVLADLPHDVRWHYLCMIQVCSRSGRIDGIMRAVDARRCSDVDDPENAVELLVRAELVQRLPDRQVKVLHVEEHVPPPHIRKEKERSKIRKRRERLHKNGDHTTCLPENCPDAIRVNEQTGEVTTPPVTGHVTRDIGTGRDGTGQALGSGSDSDVTGTRDQTVHSSSEELCFTCGKNEVTSGSECAACSSGGSHHHLVSEGSASEVPMCAFSGCVDSARPGRVMCSMHYTREPAGGRAA